MSNPLSSTLLLGDMQSSNIPIIDLVIVILLFFFPPSSAHIKIQEIESCRRNIYVAQTSIDTPQVSTCPRPSCTYMDTVSDDLIVADQIAGYWLLLWVVEMVVTAAAAVVIGPITATVLVALNRRSARTICTT